MQRMQLTPHSMNPNGREIKIQSHPKSVISEHSHSQKRRVKEYKSDLLQHNQNKILRRTETAAVDHLS